MSDQQTLEAMLDRAGIVWTVREDVKDAAVVLEVLAKDGPKNLGYIGFVSHLGFDEDGSLLNWDVGSKALTGSTAAPFLCEHGGVREMVSGEGTG